MYTIDGTTITMTRGDTVIIEVGMTRNGTPYTPQAGDSVRFALKHAKFNAARTDYADADPLVLKPIPTDTMLLRIEPEDTADLGFGEYAYDIEITFENGDVDTFIAAARFVLAPEVH